MYTFPINSPIPSIQSLYLPFPTALNHLRLGLPDARLPLRPTLAPRMRNRHDPNLTRIPGNQRAALSPYHGPRPALVPIGIRVHDRVRIQPHRMKRIWSPVQRVRLLLQVIHIWPDKLATWIMDAPEPSLATKLLAVFCPANVC